MTEQQKVTYLHSTMYLLNLYGNVEESGPQKHLHSTMYLLNHVPGLSQSAL